MSGEDKDLTPLFDLDDIWSNWTEEFENLEDVPKFDPSCAPGVAKYTASARTRRKRKGEEIQSARAAEGKRKRTETAALLPK